MRSSNLSASEQIRIRYCKEWRHPGFEALRLRMRFFNRVENIQNVVCFGGLKKAVFFVKGEPNSLLAKIAADLDGLGAASSEYVDAAGLDESRVFSIADHDH